MSTDTKPTTPILPGETKRHLSAEEADAAACVALAIQAGNPEAHRHFLALLVAMKADRATIAGLRAELADRDARVEARVREAERLRDDAIGRVQPSLDEIVRLREEKVEALGRVIKAERERDEARARLVEVGREAIKKCIAIVEDEGRGWEGEGMLPPGHVTGGVVASNRIASRLWSLLVPSPPASPSPPPAVTLTREQIVEAMALMFCGADEPCDQHRKIAADLLDGDREPGDERTETVLAFVRALHLLPEESR